MSRGRRELKKSLRTNFEPDARHRMHRVRVRAEEATRLPGLLLGGRIARPVFIVGAPRSGTSLLYSVLSRSTRLARRPPGEFHQVWEADYHPCMRNWESNALDASDLRERAAARIHRGFYLIAGSRLRLLDKTPRNALRIPFIDALFPDATYVFIQRDGRENVNSLINAWRSPGYRTYELPKPHSIPGTDPKWWKFVLYPGWRADAAGPLEVVCAKQWSVCNERILDALESVPEDRRVAIRYEDLVDRPADEIGRLVDGLGLPLEDDVRRRAEGVRDTPINVVTAPEPGKYKRENPAEIDAILPLISTTMHRLGYEH